MTRFPRFRSYLYCCLLAVALASRIGELQAQEKSFLWKISSGEAEVYLVGSIHYLKPHHYPLARSIEESFERSERLLFEIDLDAASPERIQQLTLEKGLFRDGGTLRSNVSKETYEWTERRARQLGIDLKAMSLFKPWFVALNLTALHLQKLGYNPDFGVDRYLAGLAKKAKKPIGGLETVEVALGLFDELSPREQEALLQQTLENMDTLETGIERIVRAWVSGNAQELETILLGSMKDYPEVQRRVIDDRNRRWLPQVERLIAGGSKAMIVVGAAHLVGKSGLIESLKQRGYTLEQR